MPKTKISVIGDSHAKFFYLNSLVHGLLPQPWSFDCRTRMVVGGTIKGFGRRQSTLRIQEAILAELKESLPDVLLLNFGQVDIELGFYYGQVIRDEKLSFDVYARSLADTYVLSTCAFLERHIAEGLTVILKGVNLPVLIGSRPNVVEYTKKIITENLTAETEQEAALQRLSRILPDDLERTRNHVNFNSLLKSRCGESGLAYFDINDAIRSSSSPLVDARYISAEFDHHLVDSLDVRLLHWRAVLALLGDPKPWNTRKPVAHADSLGAE